MKLDGTPDEPIWQQATLVTGLASLEPIEGLPPAAQITVRLFYDSEALYVGARITMPPGQMRGQLAARERWTNDDSFEVIIDPFHDRRTGYDFGVNPYGAQMDWTIVHKDWSTAWDGVWDSAAARYPDGFSVEMRIPFRTLRFSSAEKQDWGIGFGFASGAKKQYDTWPTMSADAGVIVAQLGTLHGITSIDPPGKLDIIPTLVAGYGGADVNGHFAWDPAVLASARRPGLLDPGVDLRYGITPATSANLTVNPDFSQVEADTDQLVYNLRYPIFLDEKRSFFLEGANLFTTPVQLLYTRSIVEPVVGLKLSGREGRWAFGVLSAWDQLPLNSQVVETTRMSGFEDLSGKDAIDTIGRASYDLGGGSSVGLFFADKTLYDRASGRFDARNDVASADALLAFGDIYTVAAQVGGSVVKPVGGGDQFMGELYSVDARRHDKNLTVELHSQYYSRDFRAETSPITRVDIIASKATGTYRFYTQSDLLPFVEPGLALSTNHEQVSLDLLDYTISPAIVTRVGSNADLTFYYRRGQETFVRRFDGIDVVGATLAVLPTSYLALTAELSGGDQINYDRADLFLGKTVLAKLGAAVRPTDQLELELRTTKSLLWRPDGSRADNVSLYYGKLSFSFTTRLAFRAISQLDTFSENFSNSALLSYVIYPGTEAYLGYQDSSIIGTGAHTLDRRFFLKCSYRLQP